MEDDVFEEILATVRAFVHDVVVPAENEIEVADAVPERIRSAAAGLGLFGYMIPQKYGGLGCSSTQDVRIAIELGQTCPAFRSMFGTGNGIAGQVLVNAGTEAQCVDLLPRIATGELIAAFALTEEEAGSDPSGMRTWAVRDGSGYVINGEKRFITNADNADVFMVFARTGTERDAISVFVVPAVTPGVRVGPRDAKMGQRGTTTASVHFDEVWVPEVRLVGEEGEGYRIAMRSLARGRLHIAGYCVGMASRLIEESISYASIARQGGEPISRFQQVQVMLADSATEYLAGHSLVIAAAKCYDDGSDRFLAPSAAKLYCSEMVGRVADRAVQVHGGSGYMKGGPVERLYRDARLFRIYEGTSEIQRLIIAGRLLRQGKAHPDGRDA